MHVLTIEECHICGGDVEARIRADWHPSKITRRMQWAMDEHLETHPRGEVLRLKVRQSLATLGVSERMSMVRDAYRGLLGQETADGYRLGTNDSQGTYSLEEVLGGANVYAAWCATNRCSAPACEHGESARI